MVFWHLKIIQFRSRCCADTSKEIDNSLSSCCFKSSPQRIFSAQTWNQTQPLGRTGRVFQVLSSSCFLDITEWNKQWVMEQRCLQFHHGYLRQGPGGRCPHCYPPNCIFTATWFNISLVHLDLVFPGEKKNLPHNPIANHAGDSAQVVAAPDTTAVKRDNNETSPKLQQSAKRKGLCTLSGREGSHRIPVTRPDLSLGHEIQRRQQTKPSYTYLWSWVYSEASKCLELNKYRRAGGMLFT